MTPHMIATAKVEIELLLKAFPELMTDAALRADTIEGETSFGDVMTFLERAEAEAAADAGKIAGMIAELELRQKRHEERSEALRKTIQEMMDTAGVSGFKLPQATLSVSSGKPKVIEIERDLCPLAYRKTPPWQPDKTAIGNALASGEEVPGYQRGNPVRSLRILRK